MFAIVRTGGKQYRVAPGDKIVVERMDGNAGDKINLGDILLAGEGSDLKSVDGLKIQAEIVAQAKGEKVTVFKKRRRHNYRRKQGHRQLHTILKILSIGDQKAPKEDKKAAAPAKDEAPKTETKAVAPTETAPAAAAKTDKAPAKKSETKPAAKASATADTGASTENAAPAKATAKKPAAKAPAKKK